MRRKKPDAQATQSLPATIASTSTRETFPIQEEAKPMLNHLNNRTGRPFPRGAHPTPRHLLLAAQPFRPLGATPPYFFIFPKNIDQNGALTCWGNATYGNCVTAEEAFNKACNGIFISDQVVVDWCNKNGTLNGANLQPVIQQMQAAGFPQDGNVYGDGAGLGVNYGDQPTLNAAIYAAGQQGGCVKFGLAANQLPPGAGNSNGWTLAADSPDTNEDHCMGACGFGTIGQFIAAINAAFGLNLPVPTADGNGAPIDLNAVGVAIYTWSTIGWCAFPAFVNMTGEAWIRNPSSVNTGSGVPAPDSVYITGGPTPPPPPPPPPPPRPVFIPPYYIFEGQTLMGLVTGYPDAVTAGAAAQALANHDQVPVSIRDSAGNLVGTATPNVVPPPPPPPSGLTLTITPVSFTFSNPPALGTFELMPAGTREKFAELAAMIAALGGGGPPRFHGMEPVSRK
jgi:hypothetical protein